MRKLFLSGLIALGLLATGCSSDDIDNPTTGGGGELKGYLTLSLVNKAMNSPKTAGHETPEREVGTAEENKVHDVTVALTDATGTITALVSPAIQSGTTTQKFEVEAGVQHKVFALVNNASSVAVGDNIATVIDNATAAEITAGFKAGKFFMTNSQSDIAKTPLDAGIDITVNAGEEKVAKIAVDRLAAKVEDNTAAAGIDLTELPEGAKAIVKGVRVVGFVPMNLNSSMNLIQTWGTANFTEPAVAENILQTPGGSYLLPAEGTYKESANGIGIVDKTAETDFVKKVYVTENRPVITFNSELKPTAKRGEATAVIYRVVAQDADGADLSTFYVYNDVVYTDRAKLNEFFAKAGDDISALTDAKDLRAKNIRVYENGVMYYTYFILDPNTNYTLGGKDYYSTFRNSIYKLNITKLKNLGDDVPEDSKTPEEVIDPDEAYLQVELTIKDWVINTIDIEF
ncbi:Mfa1 family fimbria major subunit [Dysgonomonas massiliensis]|uniref:Mfa1 family fimbria major subunit n=1 Tax=Dysgonomonas massiliensis TaxID=2040292 RepID=UPI000C779C6D|nr:Mfa1 family fimbria major subunit [Dysgonomonas massiliensis]